MQTEKQFSIYALAHTDVGSLPFNNRGRTLRVVVPVNIQAGALALRFANYYGGQPLPIGRVSLALCNEKGVLRPGASRPVTLGGEGSFTLPAGASLLSDWLELPVSPGDWLALSIHYPGEPRVQSGNRIDSLTLRSRPGDYCAEAALPAPGLLSRLSRTAIASGAILQVTSICEIVAKSDAPHRVLACFGDSITQQGNWTVPLRRRLARRLPGQVSLCNLGIGGNRLLQGPPAFSGGLYGPSGLARFERDVLGLSGLGWVLLALGSNDLGIPGLEGTPEEELPNLAQLAAGLEKLAEKARGQGIKAYAATLAPRPIDPPYTAPREALRLGLNEWIRKAACFDAVIDFDKALCREDGRAGMREGYALPDGLHPSPFGGLWMAKAIDLSLFGEEKCHE